MNYNLSLVSIAIITVSACLLLSQAALAQFQSPYPRSKAIAGVTFNDSTARVEAPGSDIWPITWAANGQLYTTWGDGGGFGGTNKEGRVFLGVARVEGGKQDYKGFNIAGGVNSEAPAPFAGKSEGILAIGNRLYLWRDGDKSSLEYFKFAELWESGDLGKTWRATGVRFSDGEFFAPAFLQFGKGYGGARDDYVYIYAPDIIDPTHWNIRLPGRINLMRVKKDRIADKSAYEFFGGPGPKWTQDVKARRPVWEDKVNGTHRIAVSYNPGLKRYLLTTIATDRSGWMCIYDAPAPWGPWTLAHLEHNPERWGRLTIIFTFVNKWLSADGRDFVIVHTKDDHWASIEGKFGTSR